MSDKKKLFSGTLSASLKTLQEKIRNDPAKPELRVYLFQLLCVIGDFKKAMTQLNIAADMSDENKLMAQACRPLLNCEVLRQEIFMGLRSPLIFGKPEEWLGLMVQALKLDAQKKHIAARSLREKAFDSVDTISGTLNGETFEWLADADSRLGPILEIIIEGRYYLAALSNIKKMIITAPSDLRDAVWLPVSIVWKNNGQVVGFIPTRYQGSPKSKDDAILLARKTDWEEVSEDIFFGLGQRMLVSDRHDYPIMEVRELLFNHK